MNATLSGVAAAASSRWSVMVRFTQKPSRACWSMRSWVSIVSKAMARRSLSAHGQAAADADGLPGDVGGLVGGEEGDGVGEVGGLREPAERDGLGQRLPQLRVVAA